MKTFKQKFEASSEWQIRASIIDLFHLTKRRKHLNWKIKDTANYFAISSSHASEDILIIKNIELVQFARSRNHALKLIRGYNDRKNR